MRPSLPCRALLFLLSSLVPLHAAVLLNEIMYHPVEEPAFDAAGKPVLDLYSDIHEYIELHNTGASPVSLAGWELTGGVDYVFPASAGISPGGFLVIAKDPDRLAAVPAYALARSSLLGPWEGNLSNEGETVRLRDSAGRVIDSVAYSPRSPWPISANALGAGEDWTGLKDIDFQYRGRSLERVSTTASSNDPANWLASPIPGNPSPGKPNTVSRPIPQPVVVQRNTAQASTGQRLLRRGEPIRIECLFSSTNGLSQVRLDYFIDDINLTNESIVSLPMLPVGHAGQGQFVVDLPGQPDRAVIRYRIRAERGSGDEVVSPRPDDPFRWHAAFVTPARTGTNPVYDVFVSARSLTILRTNISQNPRRVTNPDPPGRPRASWNATQPAIFAHDGIVYDIQMRHHGSRYRRDPNRRSYKFQFPRYQLFNQHSSTFVTDKGPDTAAGHAIFRAAGLPTSLTRSVDLYLNSAARDIRLEQEEYDDYMLDRYHTEQALLHPDEPLEETGELYKCVGFDGTAEGPYGNGNARLLPARTPHWTPLQRYEWTFSQQNHTWRGHTYFKEMIEGMWATRGNTTINTNAARTYFNQVWDIDKQLTHLATINWMVPWDDVFHNYFVWQQRNGRWSQLPWDFDSVLNGQSSSASIFNGVPNQSPANFFKTTFIAVFRDEFRERAWFLNNTVLHPDHLRTLGISAPIISWSSNRVRSVNTQLGLGTFQRPNRPSNQSPANGANASPLVVLRGSSYGHSASPAAAHHSTTWLIRPAGGSYYAPTYQNTTTNDLTSHALPPGLLTLGQTYHWKCLYTDANGHPSIASPETAFTVAAAPEPGGVVLNEVMALNRSTVANGGRFPDWIELHNPTDRSVSLGGYSLTDDLTQPARYPIPAGTTIAPRGFLIVWCDSADRAPGLHSGFGLSGDGQTVGLYQNSPDGWILRDAVTFGPQLVDLSVGRIPDAAAGWSLAQPTPGTANRAQELSTRVNLRVNEWMASATSDPDWIELYNPNPAPAPLAGLSLTDDLRRPAASPFPPLSFLPARGFLRMIADGDPARGGNHAAFQLSAQGGAIGLFSTNGTAVDVVFYGLQTPDLSQGRVPDGGTPIYPVALHGTPEASNAVDRNGNGLPDIWELAHGLGLAEAHPAGEDADQDGLNNGDEFLAGTDPTDPESRLALQLPDPVVDGNGNPRIQFRAESGIGYSVQYRESLDDGPWLKLADVFPQPGARLVEVPDPGAPFNHTRYYRVLTPIER